MRDALPLATRSGSEGAKHRGWPRACVVAMLAAAALLGACGGDTSTRTPDASPPATAMPRVVAASPSVTEPSPVATTAETERDASFRAFVGLLDAAIRRGDVAFIASRLKLETKTCGTEDVELRDDPLCETIGHTYEGLPVGHWRSSGGIVPTADALASLRRPVDEQLPAERDDAGDGAARIGAINVQEGHYAAVLTAMISRPANFDAGGPLRVTIGTSWTFEEGEWRTDGMLIAYVLAEELLTPGLAVSPYERLELFSAR